MDISRFKRLKDAVWFAPFESHPEFEVCIRPSAATVFFGVGHPQGDEQIATMCRDVFVDFRGAKDGEKDVPNTFPNRVMFCSNLDFIERVKGKMAELQNEAQQGEADADSG